MSETTTPKAIIETLETTLRHQQDQAPHNVGARHTLLVACQEALNAGIEGDTVQQAVDLLTRATPGLNLIAPQEDWKPAPEKRCAQCGKNEVIMYRTHPQVWWGCRWCDFATILPGLHFS